MTTIVTVTATAPAIVIVETIVDEGRERRPNGQFELAADQSQVFIVSENQSLRVVEAPAAPVAPAA